VDQLKLVLLTTSFQWLETPLEVRQSQREQVTFSSNDGRKQLAPFAGFHHEPLLIKSPMQVCGILARRALVFTSKVAKFAPRNHSAFVSVTIASNVVCSADQADDGKSSLRIQLSTQQIKQMNLTIISESVKKSNVKFDIVLKLCLL